MAGGQFQFGPTYNSTRYVRAMIEGDINGFYEVDVDAAQAAGGELAGKVAGITAAGKIALAGANGANSIGIFREDLGDMVNASGKASFYFRGGEYHIAEARLGTKITDFKLGDEVTSDANGALIPMTSGAKAVGTVISIGDFPMGNMYKWAGEAMNGGKFLGIILHM